MRRIFILRLSLIRTGAAFQTRIFRGREVQSFLELNAVYRLRKPMPVSDLAVASGGLQGATAERKPLVILCKRTVSPAPFPKRPNWFCHPHSNQSCLLGKEKSSPWGRENRIHQQLCGFLVSDPCASSVPTEWVFGISGSRARQPKGQCFLFRVQRAAQQAGAGSIGRCREGQPARQVCGAGSEPVLTFPVTVHWAPGPSLNPAPRWHATREVSHWVIGKWARENPGSSARQRCLFLAPGLWPGATPLQPLARGH